MSIHTSSRQTRSRIQRSYWLKTAACCRRNGHRWEQSLRARDPKQWAESGYNAPQNWTFYITQSFGRLLIWIILISAALIFFAKVVLSFVAVVTQLKAGVTECRWWCVLVVSSNIQDFRVSLYIFCCATNHVYTQCLRGIMNTLSNCIWSFLPDCWSQVIIPGHSRSRKVYFCNCSLLNH